MTQRQQIALDWPAVDALLAPMPAPIASLARDLIATIAEHPGLSGRVMPGWRSVNFRHAQAGHVCAVFAQPERVSLYFEHGRLLQDDAGLLVGEGLKKGRVLRLLPGDAVPRDTVAIPRDHIALLLAEAIALFA